MRTPVLANADEGPELKSSSDKLLSLLMHFNDRSHPWSVDELSAELGLPNSTTYRYLRALSQVGLVVAVSAGAYILGPSIIALDRQMRMSDPLLRSAAQVKLRVAREVEGPGAVLVCRLFRDSVMCVDSVEVGTLEFEVSYARGRELPLFRGAASKVILANIPLRNVRTLYDGNREHFGAAGLGDTWESARTSLRKIRQAGSSVTHGELDEGAIGIASPILDPEGQILGSLGYVTLERTVTKATLTQLCATVKAGAAEIQLNLAARLG